MSESNPPFDRTLKRAIKKRDGYQCVICQCKYDLTIHHINGNHNDNRPENLETRCEEHHQMVHYTPMGLKYQGKIKTIIPVIGQIRPDFQEINILCGTLHEFAKVSANGSY